MHNDYRKFKYVNDFYGYFWCRMVGEKIQNSSMLDLNDEKKRSVDNGSPDLKIDKSDQNGHLDTEFFSKSTKF